MKKEGKKYIHGESYPWGIMIRSNKKMAITIKNKDDKITEKIIDTPSIIKKHPILKTPIIRGITRYIEGSKYQFEGEKHAKKIIYKKNIKKENNPLIKVLSIFIIGLIIYFIFPTILSYYLKNYITNNLILNLFETSVRMGIFFLGFLFIKSTDEKNQRERFHGAEHKAINYYIKEGNLNFEEIKKYSIYNPACGTSFFFFFFIIPFPFLIFFPYTNIILRILGILILTPIFVGLSFDLIIWLSESQSLLAKILSKPGVFLQKFTVKEPSDEEIKVAIISLKNSIL